MSNESRERNHFNPSASQANPAENRDNARPQEGRPQERRPQADRRPEQEKGSK